MKLADFEGRWRLDREITHKGAPDATYVGEAEWTPDANGLAYREHGLLTVSGHPPMTTERRYGWRPGLEVYFEDGRFFHQVPPEGGETKHWCDPDEYRVVYRFDTWPRFETVWRVRGPRKDYTMVSCYRPFP